MASALESSTGGVAGRQPSVAQQHIGIDLSGARLRLLISSSCAGSRRRRWSRASSGVAAPVEGVVGRGGTAAGCATGDQCTKLQYRPTAAVLASTADSSSVPYSSQRLQHNLHVQHVWPTDPGSVGLA